MASATESDLIQDTSCSRKKFIFQVNFFEEKKQ